MEMYTVDDKKIEIANNIYRQTISNLKDSDFLELLKRSTIIKILRGENEELVEMLKDWEIHDHLVSLYTELQIHRVRAVIDMAIENIAEYYQSPIFAKEVRDQNSVNLENVPYIIKMIAYMTHLLGINAVDND